MQNLKLQLKIQNVDIQLYLKSGRGIIDHEDLTISRNLDTLLIRAIDKILSRNRIGKLYLRTLEIPAKLKDGAVSNMIIRTIKAGLEV